MDIEENFDALCTGCVKYFHQMSTRYKEEIKKLQDELQSANEALDESNLEIDRLRNNEAELKSEVWMMRAEQAGKGNDSLPVTQNVNEELTADVKHPFDTDHIKTEPEANFLDVEVKDEPLEETIETFSEIIGSNETIDLKSFECLVCRRSYETVVQLNCHLKYSGMRWYLLNPDTAKSTVAVASVHTQICHEPGCGMAMQTQAQLTEHMWMHIRQPYACPKCEKIFPIYDMDVSRHEESCTTSDQNQIQSSLNTIFNALLTCERLKTSNTVSNRGGTFNCDIPKCKKTFWYAKDLKAHKTMSHPISPIVDETVKKIMFKCSEPACSKEYSNKCELARHFKYFHLNLKPFHCDAPGCGKNFRTKSYFKAHQKKHLEHYECTACERVFASKTSLRLHLKSHDENKSFKCKIADCTDIFTYAVDLRTHMLTVHADADEIQYKCTEAGCTKVYFHKKLLQEHIQTIHFGKRYPCEQPDCDRVFSRKTNLARHTRDHTEGILYLCNECGARYRDAEALEVHMRCHSGERPFLCKRPDCGKSFISSGTVREHMKTHAEDRSFPCEYPGCEKVLCSETNRNHHMNMHSGVKPYVCMHPACNSTFTNPDALAKHTRIGRHKQRNVKKQERIGQAKSKERKTRSKKHSAENE